MWIRNYSTIATILALAHLASCAEQSTVQDNSVPMDPDKFFTLAWTDASLESHSLSYPGYKWCCTIFSDEHRAVKSVVAHMVVNGLGNLDEYGFVVGQTSSLYIVDAAPRFFDCGDSPNICDGSFPYFTKTSKAYTYILDRESAVVI